MGPFAVDCATSHRCHSSEATLTAGAEGLERVTWSALHGLHLVYLKMKPCESLFGGRDEFHIVMNCCDSSRTEYVFLSGESYKYTPVEPHRFA